MKNKIVRGQRKSDGWGNAVIDPTQCLKAQIELENFKKPKASSFGHKGNVAKYVAEGTADTQYQFLLIDYRNGNEVLKKKMLSHKEVWKRNKVLEGTGFAWAKLYS